MTHIERHRGGLAKPVSRRQQRQQARHEWELERALREIDSQAVVAIAQTNAVAAVESNVIRRVIGLHKAAMSEVTSYSLAERHAIDMAPGAVHRIAAISSRLVVEVDEALDDCSHKLTGRGQ